MRWLLIGLLWARAGLAGAGLEFSGDFVSEYVFRGSNQRQGTSIQPALAYDILDSVRASLWANVRLEGSLAVTETDYSLQWSWLDAGLAELTLGGIYYDRSARIAAPETLELFAGLEFRVPGRPALYAYWDLDRRPGVYWELTAKHRFLLPDYRGTVDLSAGLGFDTGRVNGFHDARLSLGFTRRVGDWSLSPSVDLHFPATAVDAAANGFRPVFRFSAGRSF